MDVAAEFERYPLWMMEGALGERLKREYHLPADETVALAAMIYTAAGRDALEVLWTEYADIARRHSLPLLATTPTRRANRERVERARCSDRILQDNVDFLRGVLRRAGGLTAVGGLMGCRGDAYRADEALEAERAESFHAWQAERLQKAGVDFLFAGIMPALSEAKGMARAMQSTGLPYILSFMIRRDGRLIDGTPIHDAVRTIDAAVERVPLCYMTNCVHPAVLRDALEERVNRTDTVWDRFRGIQCNTSPLPPEALDASAPLMGSDACALAEETVQLARRMQLKIIGGCCGTDGSHMEALVRALTGSTQDSRLSKEAKKCENG